MSVKRGSTVPGFATNVCRSESLSSLGSLEKEIYLSTAVDLCANTDMKFIIRVLYITFCTSLCGLPTHRNTVLAPESAVFHSWWIFWAIVNASPEHDISK